MGYPLRLPTYAITVASSHPSFPTHRNEAPFSSRTPESRKTGSLRELVVMNSQAERGVTRLVQDNKDNSTSNYCRFYSGFLAMFGEPSFLHFLGYESLFEHLCCLLLPRKHVSNSYRNIRIRQSSIGKIYCPINDVSCCITQMALAETTRKQRHHCVSTTLEGAEGRVMVWGMFSSHHLDPLVHLE